MGASAVSGPTPAWVVADIVRMEDGVLAEHWDVIQDEKLRGNNRGAAAFRCIPGSLPVQQHRPGG